MTEVTEEDEPIPADLLELGVATFIKKLGVKDDLSEILIDTLGELTLEQFMLLGQDNAFMLFTVVKSILYPKLSRKFSPSEKKFMVALCHEMIKIKDDFLTSDIEANRIYVDCILERTGLPEITIPELKTKLVSMLTRHGKKVEEVRHAKDKEGKS